MYKIFKKLMIGTLCLGILGGLTQYFSPTVTVDEEDVLRDKNSVAASSFAPIISAQGAILVRGEDGSTIYEKDADKRLYPASTTKIMTCLVAIEMLDETYGGLNSKVTIPKDAVGIEGSSLQLKEGERITVEELLYGAMLKSGNDGATALAMCMSGGKVEDFVKRMNDRAKEIGCGSTNFVNPSGLFDENHYTTARDMAKIARTAMSNDDFRKIASAKEWKSEVSKRHFVNKNKTIKEYDGATGVKIGYTKKSGRALVASAKRGETELIAVVLNDPNWFRDAYSMLDYGFERELDDKRGLEQ